MSHDCCPIIESYLLAVVADGDPGLLDADEQWTIERLRAELPMLLTGPAWVRLRGFILVENMLTAARDGYGAFRRPHHPALELTLRERSWAGLTAVIQELEELLGVLGGSLAEIKLMGINTDQIDAEDDASLTGARRRADRGSYSMTVPPDKMFLYKRALRGVVLRRATRHLREAAAILRPHLGNPAAPLHSLALSYTNFHSAFYGKVIWITSSLPAIKTAAAVRL